MSCWFLHVCIMQDQSVLGCVAEGKHENNLNSEQGRNHNDAGTSFSSMIYFSYFFLYHYKNALNLKPFQLYQIFLIQLETMSLT